jgi:hypothetical protein
LRLVKVVEFADSTEDYCSNIGRPLQHIGNMFRGKDMVFKCSKSVVGLTCRNTNTESKPWNQSSLMCLQLMMMMMMTYSKTIPVYRLSDRS